MRKKQESQAADVSAPGKINVAEMRKLINKAAGYQVAYNLKDEMPSDIKEFIPTSSTVLDYSLCRGRKGGIPIGRISVIASIEGIGKSYLAACIAAQAQKMSNPMKVIYFDAENALDSEFLAAIGCNLSEESGLYVQATSVEFVLETIESLLASGENRFLFIWDSLALTPTKADNAGTFNPLETMAEKARIIAKGMSKLVQPLGRTDSVLLVLNQLKHNIGADRMELLIDPWTMPGGKALVYAASLILRLEGSKAKASYVTDEHGFRIGSTIRFKITKSRMGTQYRITTPVQILWGGASKLGILDEESWMEACKEFDIIRAKGAWWCFVDPNNAEIETNIKFQAKDWLSKLQEPEFRSMVLERLENALITQFANRTGEAKQYFGENGNAEEEKKEE
jgi:RecA/RadA recombinase